MIAGDLEGVKVKVTLMEHKECFSIVMDPESVKDAAVLVRLKMNGTKEIRGLYAECYGDGSISGSVVIGKRKQNIFSVKA